LSKKFLTSLNLLGKATDPATGTAGDLYYNTALQTVKVYTGTEWTIISGGGSVTVADSTPADPTEGSMWFESDTGKFFVYYDNFWVELGAPGSQGPQGATGATGAAGATGATGAPGPGFAAGGTANQALVKVDASNYNTQWATIPLINSDNNFLARVGIGRAPTVPLEIQSSSVIAAGSSSVLLVGSNNTERIEARSIGADSVIRSFQSPGSSGVPSATVSGNALGNFQLGGYDGTGWARAAWVAANAAENWSPTNRGANLVISTTPIGSTSIAERVRVTSQGDVGIGTTTPAAKLDVNGSIKSDNLSSVNAILNSSFNVWQRGTTLSVAGGAFNIIADRWGSGRAGSAGGYNISRQVTNDTTNLPFIQYCMRIARNNGDTITGGIQTVQNIETINSIPFAGRTVTISAYIRKGADYSGTNMTLNLNSGTGTDQNLNQSYTGNAAVCSTTITPTTTWTRYSVTGTVASTATELALYIYQNAAGTASTVNDYIEITGVMLELGNVASPYRSNQPTYQAELAACQRYYYRTTATQSYSDFASGYNASASEGSYIIPFPVQMRITPTALEQTGAASNYNILHSSGGSAARAVCSSVPTYQVASQNAARVYFIVPGTVTAGQGSVGGSSNNTTAFLGWSAEL
jgi:hypothetical protein